MEVALKVGIRCRRNPGGGDMTDFVCVNLAHEYNVTTLKPLMMRFR